MNKFSSNFVFITLESSYKLFKVFIAFLFICSEQAI